MEIDWKKKYEEALNKARELHGTVAAGRDFLAEIFSELCESEDERIRKELLEVIRHCYEDGGYTLCTDDYKKYSDYLEKQKDSPMPEDTVVFKKGVAEGRRLEREDTEKVRRPIIETYQRSWYTEGYYDGKLKKEPRWIIKTQGIRTQYEENPKYGQSLEEEQKPLPGFDDLTPDEKMNHPLYLEGFDAGREVGRVEAEQKPAEWSEEDIQYYDAVMEMVMYAAYLPSRPRNEVIKWLKSLRPQQQQNMSIYFMMYLDEHRPDGKMCLSNAECNQIEVAFKNQDWDIILKYAEKYLPRWKPSEEQMRCLQTVVQEVNKKSLMSTTGYSPAAVLQSLYIDLKALM